MAKKKDDIPSVELTKEDFIKRLKSEITKEFGQGIFKHGNAILDRQTKIVKWSPSLDSGLSGGVPLGSWMSISGPEKHGKTYVTLCLAAAVQKQYDLPIVYLNVEGRLKRMNLLGVNGLDISEDKFIVIESTVEKTLSTQDYLKIAEKWLRTCPCMIIIDSVSSLADEKELIKKARRVRKVFGGGMRQAGFLAAAGIYALNNNIERLEEDHQHAKQIATFLDTSKYVKHILPVETNIIIFETTESITAPELVARLKEKEILGYAIAPNRVRLVLHLDITQQMVEYTIDTFKLL